VPRLAVDVVLRLDVVAAIMFIQIILAKPVTREDKYAKKRGIPGHAVGAMARITSNLMEMAVSSREGGRAIITIARVDAAIAVVPIKSVKA
jgi:hypothetical protein